jgi:uncharacterized lipoprotein YajG
VKKAILCILASVLLAGCACNQCTTNSAVKQNAQKAFTDMEAQQTR